MVIHFLDVYFQNVIYMFSDLPFESKIKLKIKKKLKNSFMRILPYKQHIEWLKPRLENY